MIVRTTALFALTATTALAQALPTAEPESVGMSSERLDRIEATFQAEVDAGRLPGVVVMVARDGQLVYSTAVGKLDPAGEEAMPEDAIFRIYSMTKPLVSVAAMMLMEEGKLTLMDPVSRHLPAFADTQVSDGEGTVAPERQMTVQDLLRHTSGLAYGEITSNETVKQGYADAGVYKPDGLSYDARGVTPDEMVAGVAATPLLHQPGTQWEYSLSSDILGRVVEAVSGQRLEDFLEERLFTPLGMESSGFSVPQNAQSRIAQTFETDPATGEAIPMIDVTSPPQNASGGAGGVSTAGDYLRFTQMLLDGGSFGEAQVLSPTSVTLMASDQLPDDIAQPAEPGELLMGVKGYTFGLGFMVREQAGIAGVPGSAGEFMWAGYGGTFFWVDPEQDLVAVMMSQRAGPSRAAYRRLTKQLVYQAITGPVDAAEPAE